MHFSEKYHVERPRAAKGSQLNQNRMNFFINEIEKQSNAVNLEKKYIKENRKVNMETINLKSPTNMSDKSTSDKSQASANVKLDRENAVSHYDDSNYYDVVEFPQIINGKKELVESPCDIEDEFGFRKMPEAYNKEIRNSIESKFKTEKRLVNLEFRSIRRYSTIVYIAK